MTLVASSCTWLGSGPPPLVLGVPTHFSGLVQATTIIPDYCNTNTPSLCPTPAAGELHANWIGIGGVRNFVAPA